MEKNILNNLFLIAIAGLAIAGLIFLGISIFNGDKWALPAALGCILLSNLFNVIRLQNIKKVEE